MKTMMQAFLLGAAIAAAGAAAAADAADPVVGTWNLNVGKSHIDGGPGPKSQTRTYTQSDDGITLTVDGVAADGSAISQQATFKYDGRAYPITGAADYDALTLRRLNASTVKSELMRDGKRIGTTTRTISGHGKVLTLSTHATSAKGVAYSAVLVFDKQ
jgi:uncharacterized protein (DUF2147 family)